MKHIIYIILSAALIVACSGNGSPFGYDKDDIVPVTPVTPVISVSVDELTFAAAGETKTITVTANVAWRLDNCPSWLTVSPESWSSTTTVKLTASANTTTSPLTGIVRFVTTDGSYLPAQLSVMQDAAETPAQPTLNVDESPLNFSASQDHKTITVEGTDEWTASVTHINGTGWCTIDNRSGKGKGSVTVNVSANDDTKERKARITINGINSGKTFNVEVIQEGKAVTPTLSVGNTVLDFSYAQDSNAIYIEGNDEWTADVSYADNRTGWCTVTPSGTAPGNAIVKVIANDDTTERVAYINLKGVKSQKSIPITVRQAGKLETPVEASISVNPSELEFDSNPTARKRVRVTSTGEWTLTCDQPWCVISNQSSTDFYVRPEQNTTISRRTAIITLTCGSKQCTVTVKQKAANIGRNEYEDEN